MEESNCIFCQIVAAQKPSFKVYEDDLVLAIMDIYPASNGHVLVIPKQHFADIFAISDPVIRATFGTVRAVSHAIKTVLDPDGLTLVQANGGAAGQTVMHYHVHVIPREQGRKLHMHGPIQGDPDRLASLARTLVEALDAAADSGLGER